MTSAISLPCSLQLAKVLLITSRKYCSSSISTTRLLSSAETNWLPVPAKGSRTISPGSFTYLAISLTIGKRALAGCSNASGGKSSLRCSTSLLNKYQPFSSLGQSGANFLAVVTIGFPPPPLPTPSCIIYKYIIYQLFLPFVRALLHLPSQYLRPAVTLPVEHSGHSRLSRIS